MGGCRYVNGEVAGIVNSAREVIAVNPSKRTVRMFGKAKIGTFKWTGGCTYKGKIIGFPRKENSLLEIDMINEKLQIRPLNIHYRGEHHYGGVMTSGGIIYQPPRNTDHMLRIDLNTMETRKIHMPGINGGCRYSASVLHPDGDIYLIPEFGYRHAILHTDTEEIEYFGDNSCHLVFGPVVGIDGNIYGFSKEGNGILKIDVVRHEIQYLCREIGNPDCYDSIVGINGRIYGVPAGGHTIWEFDVRNPSVKAVFELEENGYAKCGGAGIGPDGTIAILPCFGEYVYLLGCNRDVSVPERVIESAYFNTFF